MQIRLSSADGVPVYRQIVNQVKCLVASGRLRPGQELPPIRVLAQQLAINPNTVVHAYAELEQEGVVECRHGSGTYIAEAAPPEDAQALTAALTPQVDALVADALRLGLESPALVRLVENRCSIHNRSKTS